VNMKRINLNRNRTNNKESCRCAYCRSQRQSEVDLKDTNPRTRNDGFVEGAVILPNGTLQIGEEYTACSIIFKDAYVTCDKGFNASTNRAEFADVSIPSSSRK
jgi:hypothetical protein